jgi:hypothetical protein
VFPAHAGWRSTGVSALDALSSRHDEVAALKRRFVD